MWKSDAYQDVHSAIDFLIRTPVRIVVLTPTELDEISISWIHTKD